MLNKEKNKATVEVIATVGNKDVFKGEFLTAVLKQHVLSLQFS